MEARARDTRRLWDALDNVSDPAQASTPRLAFTRRAAMPRIRTLNTKKAPEGWDDVAPQLEEFANQMRDAVNEPHEGKRRNEATWKITKIHWERSRYVYELYYKKKAITRELYDWLLQEKYADASLIAKWRKPGFEYLCSLMAIDKRNTNFGTTAICRVPLHLRKAGAAQPAVSTGCISCSSQECGRLGGPIWWDSPRPADLIGWAKAGCPTAEKPAKKRKAQEEGEEAELEARAAALRRGVNAGLRAAEADALEAAAAAFRGSAEKAPPLRMHDGDEEQKEGNEDGNDEPNEAEQEG
ncbi:unnamed protein product [Symbiodinium necroappetens]|uniref:G10 protein n=1 Tax=Symbiodinium necroappetens TaxID=1628268 RepID=A0A813C0U6_9DINO|nr:unnamed protein product [Symbiodinium necroappetens]